MLTVFWSDLLIYFLNNLKVHKVIANPLLLELFSCILFTVILCIKTTAVLHCIMNCVSIDDP